MPSDHSSNADEPRRLEAIWVPRVEAAALVGISERHFDATLRQSLSDGAIRGEGRTLRFYGPDVVAAWHADRVAKIKAKAVEAGGDPLLADGDSPGLERYRNAKADLAEMDRDRQRKQIVLVEQIEPALLQLAGVMRSAADNLARQFGNEAAGIVNEAVDEWHDSVIRLFAGDVADRPAADGAEGSEAEDLEAVRRAGIDTPDRTTRGPSVQDRP